MTPGASTIRRLTAVDILLILLFLALAAYLYIGFYYPDPYTLAGSLLRIPSHIILLAIKVCFPLMVMAVLALYSGVRTGRIQKSSLLLLVASLFVMGLLGYVAVNFVYQQSIGQNLEQFHPYFQLMPTAYNPTMAPREKKFVIMCLGGSTTEFKDSSGRDWPSRVQERLRDAIPGKTVEVHNLGRQWYTTQHILFNYETNLRKHKPDAIILMQSINDLLQNADFSYFSRGSFREDYGHFYGPVTRIVGRKSLIANVVETIGGLWYGSSREVIDMETFPGTEPYRRNIETLIDLAERDSTKVILMTEASLFKEPATPEEIEALYMLSREAVGPDKRWSLPTALRGMQQYCNVVRNVASHRGVPIIDLEKSVPKSLEYFYDEVHYRGKTYDVVAEKVADGIRESGILH